MPERHFQYYIFDHQIRERFDEYMKAFVDHDPNPVGGESISDAELAKLDVQELLREARELIGAPPASVH